MSAKKTSTKKSPSIPTPTFTAKHPDMSVGARELKLFTENDGQLYRQQGEPCIKNLVNKVCRGDYDSKKAVDLYKYFAESGAKKYAKEFGGEWNKLFSVADRKLVAEAFVADFEAEWKAGSYRSYVPKKYQ